MHNTIRSYIKSCRSCQINMRHSQKYGHVPPKLVIMTPWRGLCVYVNPQFGTNIILERGLPDLDFFWRLPITKQGLPISEWGLYFVPSFESRATQSPFQNGDLHFRTGIERIPVLKWGSLFWNGDHKLQIPILEQGCSHSPFQNGVPHSETGT